MDNRKLTLEHFERGRARERFTHLQHVAGLSEQGRGRVTEAMKATVAHVEKTRDLQYGMQGQHLDMALNFLDKRYKGRHDLTPKEKEVIKQSFQSHFGITEPKQSLSTEAPESD